jgi:ABC-2 type transport system ATP-binding protein
MLAKRPGRAQDFPRLLPIRDVAIAKGLLNWAYRSVDAPWYVGTVTPSLPAPNDLEPEDSEEAVSAPIVQLTPSARAKKAGVRSGTASKTPLAAMPEETAEQLPVDIGPPPPLPAAPEAKDHADIVIPPKPPLPPLAEVETEVEAEVEVEAEAEAIASETEVVEPEVVDDVEAELVEPAILEPEPVEAEVVDPADGEADTELAEPDLTTLNQVSGVLAGDVESAGDVLVLRGVTKRFGNVAAVDGIDLTIPAGTFYGLVGPNGAGKTTTLSMIAGLLTPDRGTIEVGGVDAASDPRAAKRMMGVLPDRLRTFDRLTGRQLLYYYGVLRGLKPAVAESRTADLARAFDLTDALGRVVSDYSAGMLKKVMLAGALIHSPRLLVLDEPFEAVDPVSSAVIIDILSTYVAHGGTVVLSSHGMELVERMCSRVAVIVAGQVLAEGTVEEVRGELTLEQRFVELAGGLSDVEGLEWLHTFSG